jgi:serine/threonine protein kinase
VLADFGLAARITIPHPDNNGTKEGDRSAGANYDTREMAVVPVVEGGDGENEGGGGEEDEDEEDGEEDGDGSRSIPCGALLCCPPECLDSCRSGGAAADMWALGVVLWEIIEGVHPIPWQHRQLLIRKQQQKQRQHTSSLAGEHLQQLIPPAPPHVAHSPAEQPISSSFQPASAEVDDGTSRRRRGGVEEEAISKLSVGMFSANVNDEQGGVLDDDDDVEEGQFDGSDLWAISEAADELPASAALIARELMQRLELGDNNNNKRGGLPSDESSGHAWAAVAADTSSSSSFSVKAACPRAMAKTLLRSSSWAVVNTCVVIDPKSRPSAPALLTRIQGGAMNLNLN